MSSVLNVLQNQIKKSMSVENIDLVIVNFRRNCVSGSDMLRFGDSEWKDLIPYIGFAIMARQESRKSGKILNSR